VAEPEEQHEAEENRRDVRRAIVITLIALILVLVASLLVFSTGTLP
jgi:predicted nucleic acid-binding Zn ribbon protein